MLGISRWCGKVGSYRTIQRFFAQSLPWATLFWVFFREHIFCQKETYILAGLRQKTTRKKPQIKLEQGIYFNAQKIAQTQIYQENN
jgi:hypothetical protein